MSFVMIDKPMVKVIAWDMPSFLKLKEATDEAIRRRHQKFTVDLGRRYQRVEFDTSFADGICAQLANDFKMHPMPDFGENREGEEP